MAKADCADGMRGVGGGPFPYPSIILKESGREGREEERERARQRKKEKRGEKGQSETVGMKHYTVLIIITILEIESILFICLSTKTSHL